VHFIEAAEEEVEYPVEEVSFRAFSADRLELDAATVELVDVDANGLVSRGDSFAILGMTDEYNGGRIEAFNATDVIANELIEWDPDDRLRYALWLSWSFPAVEVDGRWDTHFGISRNRINVSVGLENITLEVFDGDGTAFPDAIAQVNDTNSDGLVSRWDRVELKGLTAGCQGGRVLVFYDRTLVGIGQLPNFIPSG
jgi:hypothetical protein